MPDMPDCVGDKCTVVVFDVTVTTQTYDQVDTASKAVTKQTIVPKNLKDGFEAAVKAQFPDTENGCCEGEGEDCECTCRKTAKVAAGPTQPSPPADISVDVLGITVNGTYTYTMTVYEGICGPVGPKEKKKKKKKKSSTTKSTPKKKPKKSKPKKTVKRRAG